METVQIALDQKLLLSADQAARRKKQSLSTFMRAALREHLRNLAVAERATCEASGNKDKRDREGYLREPRAGEDFVWDAVAAWPED